MYISDFFWSKHAIQLSFICFLVELNIPYMLHNTKNKNEKEPKTLFSEDRSCINDIITTYSSIVSGKALFLLEGMKRKKNNFFVYVWLVFFWGSHGINDNVVILTPFWKVNAVGTLTFLAMLDTIGYGFESSIFKRKSMK